MADRMSRTSISVPQRQSAIASAGEAEFRERGEPFLLERVAHDTGCRVAHIRRLSPFSLDDRQIFFDLLACLRPGIGFRPSAAGIRSIEHECRRALGIGRRKQHAHRAAFGAAEQHRALRADRIQHRPTSSIRSSSVGIATLRSDSRVPRCPADQRRESAEPPE